MTEDSAAGIARDVTRAESGGKVIGPSALGPQVVQQAPGGVRGLYDRLAVVPSRPQHRGALAQSAQS